MLQLVWVIMFVICGEFNRTLSCEVFDSFSRKFTKIKQEIKDFFSKRWYFYAFSIGNSIVVFQDFPEIFDETAVYFYDVDKEKWLNIQCNFTKIMYHSSFVKYHT